MTGLVFDRLNKLVGERFDRYIHDLEVPVLLVDVVTYCLEQVSFSEADATID